MRALDLTSSNVPICLEFEELALRINRKGGRGVEITMEMTTARATRKGGTEPESVQWGRREPPSEPGPVDMLEHMKRILRVE